MGPSPCLKTLTGGPVLVRSCPSQLQSEQMFTPPRPNCKWIAHARNLIQTCRLLKCSVVSWHRGKGVQKWQQVTSCRYLGIHLDNLFSRSVHVDYVCSHLQQSLYFLYRLRVFGVSQNIMFLFFQAVMKSVIRYGVMVWFGNLSTQSKSNLQCLVQTAMKVMGRTDKLSLQSIYEQSVLRQARRVVSDPSHILQMEYELLPSGRRYRIPKRKLNCFKYSFIPTSIKTLNKPVRWGLRSVQYFSVLFVLFI